MFFFLYTSLPVIDNLSLTLVGIKKQLNFNDKNINSEVVFVLIHIHRLLENFAIKSNLMRCECINLLFFHRKLKSR